MQPDAYFITTARGSIHDEEALERVLRDKKIAGAGLDVWEKEPPPASHPLMKYDNVMVTPHMAGVTRGSARPDGPDRRRADARRARRQAGAAHHQSAGLAGLRQALREDIRLQADRRRTSRTGMSSKGHAPRVTRSTSTGVERCCNHEQSDREAPLFRQLKRAGLPACCCRQASPRMRPRRRSHAWLDPKLLAAAKAEGGEMTIYSDTNEGEGLPLWKLFTEATGIKVNYVRGADPPLMARMVLEYRGNQKSWDVAQLGTIDKIPPQLLLPFDPPEAKNISPERAIRAGAGTASTPTTTRRPTTPSTSRRRSCRRATKTSRSTRNGPAMSPSTAPTANGSTPCIEYYGDDKATKTDQGHRGGDCSRSSPTAIWRGALGRLRRILGVAQQYRQSHHERETRAAARSIISRSIRWR